MTLTKLLSNLMKMNKAQVYKQLRLIPRSRAIVFNINSISTNTINVELFSEEDKDKILKIINCDSREDLLQYSITKKRAENLELHRVNNGPYKSLEDLLNIKGMNNKGLYKFYKSIIYGKKTTEHKKLIRGLVLTPKTSADDQKYVNTVLGIYVGQDIISWTLLNRDSEVLEWSYEKFSENRPKKNLHFLLETTLPIVANLPKADRYIMQEDSSTGMGYQQSRQLYHAYVEKSIICAIILSYLTTSNCKFGDTTEFIRNNIFILRQHVLRKIYGLIIQNEIISTQYMLQKLFQENDKLIETKECLPTVFIKTELRDMYNAQSAVIQEEIGWSLLIALAFLELVVHRRTDMILRNTE